MEGEGGVGEGVGVGGVFEVGGGGGGGGRGGDVVEFAEGFFAEPVHPADDEFFFFGLFRVGEGDEFAAEVGLGVDEFGVGLVYGLADLAADFDHPVRAELRHVAVAAEPFEDVHEAWFATHDCGIHAWLSGEVGEHAGKTGGFGKVLFEEGGIEVDFSEVGVGRDNVGVAWAQGWDCAGFAGVDEVVGEFGDGVNVDAELATDVFKGVCGFAGLYETVFQMFLFGGAVVYFDFV